MTIYFDLYSMHISFFLPSTFIRHTTLSFELYRYMTLSLNLYTCKYICQNIFFHCCLTFVHMSLTFCLCMVHIIVVWPLYGIRHFLFFWPFYSTQRCLLTFINNWHWYLFFHLTKYRSQCRFFVSLMRQRCIHTDKLADQKVKQSLILGRINVMVLLVLSKEEVGMKWRQCNISRIFNFKILFI